jgi:hypothetical protein
MNGDGSARDDLRWRAALRPFVYSLSMVTAIERRAATPKPAGLAQMLGWPRVRFTLAVSAFFGLILNIDA